MFSKSQTTRTVRPRDASATAAPSIISADMRVAGDLKTDGDIQIDGVVDGDIHSSSVTVGKTAEINGEIVAGTVRIWGKVNGRIRGRDVSILQTARVQGDILHETLEVERGAQVDGLVKRHAMDEQKQSKVSLVLAGGEAMADPDGTGSGAQAHRTMK